LLALAGILVAGCTAESHPNEPRPPVVPVVSVAVTEDSIELAPRGVGLPGQSPPNINQNRNAPENQGDRGAPLVVNVRVSNQLRRAAALRLEGPVDRTYPLPPASPGSFLIALETGIYRLSSPASSGTARLLVGPSRISSSGDLLTP
jgi:hypothetical protein